jgi:hypothetical protein
MRVILTAQLAALLRRVVVVHLNSAEMKVFRVAAGRVVALVHDQDAGRYLAFVHLKRESVCVDDAAVLVFLQPPIAFIASAAGPRPTARANFDVFPEAFYKGRIRD